MVIINLFRSSTIFVSDVLGEGNTAGSDIVMKRDAPGRKQGHVLFDREEE